MHPIESLRICVNILEGIEGKEYTKQREEDAANAISSLLAIISRVVTEKEHQNFVYRAIVTDGQSLLQASYSASESQKSRTERLNYRVRQTRLSIDYTIGMIEKATP